MLNSHIPTYDQMMQPTLDALRSLGGQAKIFEIHSYVTNDLNLPESIQQFPHGDDGRMTEVEYRLHWTRSYLKRVGLIDNPQRGLWRLTPEGEKCLTVESATIVSLVRQQLRDEQLSNTDTLLDNNNMLHDIAINEANSSIELSDMNLEKLRSPTPNLPDFSSARYFLRIMNGVLYSEYRSMYNEIWEQRGNPQEQVDWAEPDTWISERLSGSSQTLAMRIWRESQKALNPRYLRGSWYLSTKHRLLQKDNSGYLQLTDRGRQFIDQPIGNVIVEIDNDEGILTILRLVAEKGPGRRSEFLQAYSDHCRSFTTFKSDTVIKGSLYDRLVNLTERGYVIRRGQSYEVSDTGLAYLDTYSNLSPGIPVAHEKQSDIRKMAKAINEEARQQLHNYLFEMNPFKFEELIKLLLEEMGYDHVATTSPTNDKGVDVVGDIELGISSVREVIQVKRHRGGINRTVLDQLRGSLHRFNAVRGTIITTGRFSKGAEEAAFERGAAPITLIDGEKLLDLLINNQIGITKKSVDYFEFTPEKLAQFELDTEIG